MDGSDLADKAPLGFAVLTGLALMLAAAAWYQVSKSVTRFQKDGAPMWQGEIYKYLGSASLFTAIAILLGLVAAIAPELR